VIKYLTLIQGIFGIFTIFGLLLSIIGYKAVKSKKYNDMQYYSGCNIAYTSSCMIICFIGTILLTVFSLASDESATCTVNGRRVPFEQCRPYVIGAAAYMVICFGVSGLLHMASQFYTFKALRSTDIFL
jgi:hypothetical protein